MPQQAPAGTSQRAGAGRCIALKIDVDTLRGTLEGVPALVDALRRHGAGATFYFSVGPDHTGRALRRVFRPGFLGKVRRTSVASHYGLRTLMYGVLLPGPHIGRRAGHAMRAARDAGFEVGVHCHDHVRWQDFVVRRDAAWTRRELERAVAGFTAVFGKPPASHAAAGWQVNGHALGMEAGLGFRYASDTRGWHPFVPVMDGIAGQCPQLPTTLPTLDELVGLDGLSVEQAVDHVIDDARRSGRPAEVFTLHAELEGQQLLPQFERMLAAWRADGFALVSMGTLAARLDPGALPRHRVDLGEVPGRSGLLALQGPRVDGAA